MDILLDPDVVNSVGLLLDIAGVVMLFFFGLPSKVEHPDSGIAVAWDVPSAETERRRKQWYRHRLMSGLGLAMLILGFVLQIASNHIGVRPPVVLPPISCPQVHPTASADGVPLGSRLPGRWPSPRAPPCSPIQGCSDSGA